MTPPAEKKTSEPKKEEESAEIDQVIFEGLTKGEKYKKLAKILTFKLFVFLEKS